MIREVIFFVLSLAFGFIEAVSWKHKKYNTRSLKTLSLSILLIILTVEFAEFVLFLVGFRLPNESFCIYAIIYTAINVLYFVFNHFEFSKTAVISVIVCMLHLPVQGIQV